MANLIITVIAIALVAIASLMGAYYGGAAFLNNQSAANASTVLNQGQQVAGAWNAYLSDHLNTVPTAIGGAGNTTLVGAQYLGAVPEVPAEAGGVGAAPLSAGLVGTHYFVWASMGLGGTGAPAVTDTNTAACLRVIKTAIGPTAEAALVNVPTVAAGSIYTGAGGNGTFGCAYVAAGITAAQASLSGGAIAPKSYVMEYLLQ